MLKTKDQAPINSDEGEFVGVDGSVSDDFPIPPTFHPSVSPSVYSLSIVPDVRSEYTVDAVSSEVDLTASAVPFHPSNPLNESPRPEPRRGRGRSLGSPTSTRTPPKHYSLLVSDFPMTTVRVSHLSISHNVRGEEVLSFMITVDPGSGKETWETGKSYPDFISLGQEIRSANRHLDKKIPSFPNGVLWHDSNSAKMATVEKYLQEILSLPVRDPKVISAFFTSIMAHTARPIPSARYEGYMTKRGENLGDWEQRYCVLQGSVLEYYESV